MIEFEWVTIDKGNLNHLSKQTLPEIPGFDWGQVME
jgi:hypothetical protein